MAELTQANMRLVEKNQQIEVHLQELMLEMKSFKEQFHTQA